MDFDEFVKEAGAKTKDGDRLFSINTEANPRFHSAWCSMMYSRLLLARNFLNDNGIIFISIHEAEYTNLKMICDEIFGSGYNLDTIVWKARDIHMKPLKMQALSVQGGGPRQELMA